ncbi:molybdate ABC transporter permease subunit [Rubrivirga sp.]|uniref:molybdate ABC transporter permease subunit n=1 Tax=Rubrivirga sp. TaxID=1885344 RepID=UPI003C7178C7
MTTAEWVATLLSLRVALVATALAAIPSIGLGWWLARSDGWWTGPVQFASLLPLALPPVVTGYALLAVLPRGMAFTWWAAVIASAVVGLPLFVQLARSGIEAVSDDVLDAARADGATGWRLFADIIAPLSLPWIAAGALLHFTRGLGEFGATLIVAGNLPGSTQTLPLALYSSIQQIGGETASLRLALITVLLAAVSLGVARVMWRRAVRP